MNTHTNTQTVLPVVAALEAAWSSAQELHPELEIPSVLIVVSSGTIGRVAVRGHFAASRWATGKGANSHEVLIAGERLADGAEAVLTTLLHEAAHASAHARGVADTSRGGRYHNGRFAKIAESLGLITANNSSIGTTTEGLTPEAAIIYGDILAALTEAITIYRHSERFVLTGATAGGSGAGAGAATTQAPKVRGAAAIALVCDCETPRRIRIAPSVAEMGGITCNVCDSAFHTP